MAINVTFYNFSKRRNSTKRPSGGTTYACLLKDDTSTVRPSIAIKWDGTSGSPAQYNYCYIPDFGRYYWVDAWEYTERQWVASCVTDVLATYKTEIGSSVKYVLRSASTFDKYAPDNKYVPIYPLRMNTYLMVGIAWATTLDYGRFVVGIVGQGNTFNAGGTGYVVITGAQLQSLIDACFTKSEQVWSSTQSLGTNIGEVMNKYGENLQKSVSNPIQFINSVCWVPFIPTTSGSTTIRLGNIDTGITAACLSDPVHVDNWHLSLLDWNSMDEAWPDLEPFTRYVLCCPPFQNLDISAEHLLPASLSSHANGGLQGAIYTDVTNGLSVLTVTAGGGNQVATASAQLGVMINLAGTTVDYAAQLSAGINAVGGTVGNIMSGNIAGAITGAASGIIGFAQASAPKAVGGGYSGGLASLKASQADRGLVVYRYSVPELDNDEVGKPLMQTKTISSLSGFVLCADGEVDCNATAAEHAELAGFLTGGFFYE